MVIIFVISLSADSLYLDFLVAVGVEKRFNKNGKSKNSDSIDLEGTL